MQPRHSSCGLSVAIRKEILVSEPTMETLARRWIVTPLFLSIFIAVTACGPQEPWRIWQAGTAKGSEWVERDLYLTKAECEAARRGLLPTLVAGTRTVCVREGLSPEEIGLE